jgi:hypothetical protein
MISKVQGPLAFNINASLTAAVLLPFTWRGYSAERWCCSSRKTVISRQNSFKEQTEFTILTRLLDPLLSNIKDYRTNLQFFSLLLVCGDLTHSWCTSPMKILEVRQHSFQKLTQFTMLNKVQDPLAWNINPSLTRATVLLLFIEWGDSAQRWCCSSRKAVRSNQNSFKDQTEFTILTRLLDPLVLT